MKRISVLVLTVCLLVGAALSGNQKIALLDLQIQQEDRNPWTHLRLNNDPAEFQFAVVSDRTGGHRESVFSRAVEQINLLQPEFVISVGDLIEGYTKDEARIAREWKEFQSYTCKLQMPFFYVPGNHDLTNAMQERVWKEKFGRRYYHFVFRDVLFLLVNSEDPPGGDLGGAMSAEQLAYFKKALEENQGVRWTIVALHKPLWSHAQVEKNGWLEMEKLLAGRSYTVFAGHVHRYQKFVRQGQNYYQLATTGGGSKLRGVRYGEFDHIAWVTMKHSGPLIANVMLDGVLPEDLKKPLTEEPGSIASGRRPPQPVRGTVYFDGTPTPNAQVTFHLVEAAAKRFTRTGDALAEADGSFVLSSYTANDGAPTGEYAVTVTLRQPADSLGRPGANLLPERYSKPETTDLRVKVLDGDNNFLLEMKK